MGTRYELAAYPSFDRRNAETLSYSSLQLPNLSAISIPSLTGEVISNISKKLKDSYGQHLLLLRSQLKYLAFSIQNLRYYNIYIQKINLPATRLLTLGKIT
jgi:hypothetical protein